MCVCVGLGFKYRGEQVCESSLMTGGGGGGGSVVDVLV